MKYRMIVRRTLFDFNFSQPDRLQLQAVTFLTDSMMEKRNDLLVIRGDDEIQFFINSGTPLSRLSHEQYCFVAAAARFLGCFPDRRNLPVWLWADSLCMGRTCTEPFADNSRDLVQEPLCC